MALGNIFNKQIAEEIIQRIERLQPDTSALWGKMPVHTMLAHCNVTYEMVYEEGKHPKPGGFMKLILKLFVKKKVVNEGEYPKNGPTAPQFIIKDERVFETEKSRLINYIRKTQELGSAYFNNRESHSFGKLSSVEWNNMFYKHLDHHLKQFGV